MPGLSLGANFGAAFPSAALPPSYASDPGGGTISSRAYGIAGQSVSGGSHTAAYGSVGAGIVATGILLWLWYSLPR